MKKYILKLLSGQGGKPSAKRHASALFGISAVVFAACGFDADIVGIFLAASIGGNIATVFEARKK